MGLYGVANSCVKTVTAARDPESFRPNLKSRGRRDDGKAIVQGPGNSNSGHGMGPSSAWQPPWAPLTVALMYFGSRANRPRWYNGYPPANTGRMAAAGGGGIGHVPALA